MQQLSITTAWTETRAFVKREAGLLLPIVLGFITLPGLLLQLIAPAAAPGQQPEAGAWMLLILPIMALALIGQLAISALALGSERVVGQSIAHSARRFLPAFGALLILLAGVTLVAVPTLTFLILFSGESRAIAVVVALLVVVAFLFLWIRFMVFTPVAAAEPIGAIAILKRSWQLTKGHSGKLIGLAAIFVIVALIIGLAVTAVGGLLILLVAGRPEPGNLSFFLTLILSALLQTFLILYFIPLVARVYAQLAGRTNGS